MSGSTRDEQDTWRAAVNDLPNLDDRGRWVADIVATIAPAERYALLAWLASPQQQIGALKDLVVVCARAAGLSWDDTADALGISHNQINQAVTRHNQRTGRVRTHRRRGGA